MTSLAYAAAIYLGYPLGSLMTVPLIERLDCKWLIVASGSSMAVLGLLYANTGNPVWIIILGFVYTAASNVFANGIHVYDGELFPAELRARTAGMPYALSQLSLGIMPFLLVPALFRYGPNWVFGSTGAALLLAVTIIAVLGPSTTGLTLEEISNEKT